MSDRSSLDLMLASARRLMLVGLSVGLALLLLSGVVYLRFADVSDPYSPILFGPLGSLALLLFVALLLVGGPLRSSLRGLRLMLAILTLALSAYVYFAGSYALAFAPLVILIVLHITPSNYRYILGVAVASLFTLAAQFSIGEHFPALEIRSTVVLWAIIWPLAILLGGSLTLEERKHRVIKSLCLTSGVIGVLIIALNPEAIHGAVGTSLSFALWYWLHRFGAPALSGRLLLFAIATLGLLNNLYAGGGLSIPILPMHILFALALFPTYQGALAASLFVILGAYGFLHWGDETQQGYVFLSLTGTFIYMLALFTYMSRTEYLSRGHHLAYPLKSLMGNFFKSLVIIFPVYLVLYLPLNQLLQAELVQDKQRLVWLLMSLVLTLIGTWLLTVFLVSREQQTKMNGTLRELNEELKQQRSELEFQRQRQGQIVAAIGSRLTEPMHLLKSQLEQVAPYALGRDRVEIQSTLRYIVQTVEDLNAVTDSDLSRAHEVEAIRPGDLVRVAARSQESMLSENGVTLEVSIDSTSRLVCEASPRIWQYAVSTLLKNVVQHSDAKRAVVSLSATQESSRLILDLRVEDDGKDISAELKGELFQPFYESTSAAVGTGMGLSILRSRVEAEGGSITYFHSALGGAGFHLKIEANLGRQSALPESQALVRGIDGLRVLLVEDNPHLLRITGAILEKAGARVTLAENGDDALKRVLNGELFDLVLTDIFMPVMDGYDLTRKLRQNGFGRVILAVTAASVGRERDRIIEAGADECLYKPVSVAAIEAAYLRSLKL